MKSCDHTWGKENIFNTDGSWITVCVRCRQQLGAGGANRHPNPPSAAEDDAFEAMFGR